MVPPPPPSRIGLLVLGMHRSGTSALGGLLVRLGAHAPHHLMQGNDDNPSGYYESALLTDFHDRVLADLGSQWHDCRPLDDAWLDQEPGQQRVVELAELISREYGDAELFLAKDPRVCRLFPMWLAAAPQLGIELRAVLPLRHPLEVARSLQTRDDLTTSHALALWLGHVLEAERSSRGTTRVITRFADLLHDWRSVAERVADQLDVEWAAGWRDSTEADDYLTPHLRHYVNDRDKQAEPEPIAALAFRAYEALERASGGPGDAELAAELDSVRAEFDNLLEFATALAAPSDTSRFTSRIAALEDAAAAQARTISEQAERHAAELAARRELAAALVELTDRAAVELRAARAARALAEEKLEQRSLDVAELSRRLITSEAELALAARDLRTSQLRVRGFRREVLEHARLVRSLREDRPRLSRLILGFRPSDPVLPEDKAAQLRLLEDSDLFNPVWYLDMNPDVRAAGINPALHYLFNGAGEGRDPGPTFSTSRYLRLHKDVAEAGVNPLVHFLTVGRAEGRTFVNMPINKPVKRRNTPHAPQA